MKIDCATMSDFNYIIEHIADYWGNDRTLALHHPSLINEFGNTAFVIRDNDIVIAYLFGYFSQIEDLAYIHLIGVLKNHQRKGLGKMLYDKMIGIAKSNNYKRIKAITGPTNQTSINFHTKIINMQMLGQPNENGINVIKNYSGIGKDRCVFIRDI